MVRKASKTELLLRPWQQLRNEPERNQGQIYSALLGSARLYFSEGARRQFDETQDGEDPEQESESQLNAPWEWPISRDGIINLVRVPMACDISLASASTSYNAAAVSDARNATAAESEKQTIGVQGRSLLRMVPAWEMGLLSSRRWKCVGKMAKKKKGHW